MPVHQLTPSKQRRDVILMARELCAVHDTIDEAIGRSATALAKAMELRKSRRNLGVEGQPLVTTMIDGLLQLGAVRATYIHVHTDMATLGVNRGFLTTAEGDLIDKPDWQKIDQGDDEKRAA